MPKITLIEAVKIRAKIRNADKNSSFCPLCNQPKRKKQGAKYCGVSCSRKANRATNKISSEKPLVQHELRHLLNDIREAWSAAQFGEYLYELIQILERK